MAWYPISYTVPQYLDTSVSPPQPASGFVLKAYQVGTTTNIPFATDNEGTTQENSIALNAQGYPEVSGNIVIPHMDQDYKLALYPSQTAANSDSGAVWTVDDIDLVEDDDTSTTAAADYNVWPLVDYGGAYFDGTNDYLTRGAGLTGASNGKKGTLVAFVTFDNSASAQEYVLHATGGKLLLRRDSDGVFRIIAQNSAGSTILNMATSNAYETPDTVYCIMASWDLASTGSNSIYVNDTADTVTTTFTNDTIDYTVADWAIGADVSGSNKMTGNVLSVWLDITDNLDFDTELNRRRFLDEQDNPVSLGSSGELPTGSQPILFLGESEERTFTYNRGSGGSFTENGSTEESSVEFDGQYSPSLPSGIIQMYGGSEEPPGWFFCSGQAVSRTTYAALFNAIGTTFGNGDGSTTFNVPDLRDRSPLGENTMGASDAGRVGTTSTGLGDSGGEDEHTLTESEMPSHTHTTPDDIHASQSQNQGGTENANVGPIQGNTTSSAGGDNAHNNMHPFLALNFIIKT